MRPRFANPTLLVRNEAGKLEFRTMRPERTDTTEATAVERAKRIVSEGAFGHLPVPRVMAEIRGIGLKPAGLRQVAAWLPNDPPHPLSPIRQIRAGLLAMALPRT